MSKRARRILVTSIVLLFATLIVWSVVYGKMKAIRSAQAWQAAASSSATAPAAGAQAPGDSSAATQAHTKPSPAAPSDASASTAPNGTTTSPASPATFTGLRAVAAGGDLGPRDQRPQPLGSLDPRKGRFEVRLSRFGAGIERIAFADIWNNAVAKRQAAQYIKQLGPDAPFDISRLPDAERYILVTRSPSRIAEGRYNQVPIMAARGVTINGSIIDLVNDASWSETAPGEFQSRIVDAAGNDVAMLTRRFSLGAEFDITVEQHVRNLSARPIDVRWQQFGPVDLPVDPADYIQRRRLHFGYLPDPVGRPTLVLADANHVTERGSAIKQHSRAMEELDPAKRAEMLLLWPTADTRTSGMSMSWFSTTNRYFGLAVHPVLAGKPPVAFSLEQTFAEVEVGVSNDLLFTVLHSPSVSLASGAEHTFNHGVFAGPLDPQLLDEPPFDALSMSGMIIYNMSGCCTWLTFQWLAHLLLWFVSFLHDYVFRDWGLAIIGLVVVVRALLHPLTKKSQVNMQRFGKQMQALKPEIDKLQKKFGSEPKRMQQEQMKLMREHGVNPLQILGCLPMFLQMPIWIALWATLYLAFDIRQQSAFYGVFQMFGNWPFLSDLSSQDSFIPLGPGFRVPLFGWHVTSVNLLPLLMGVVFFVQQKYMTPPPGPNVTPEMKQQQAIMKWMMVLMMPLIMYQAPSGLTLYIMTSSIIGIMESRYVRRHIEQMDLKSPPPGAGAAVAGASKPKKPKDSLGRAWAERIEGLRQRQQQRQQERKSFKKRK